jgi:hypothetical protein
MRNRFVEELKASIRNFRGGSTSGTAWLPNAPTSGRTTNTRGLKPREPAAFWGSDRRCLPRGFGLPP